MQRSAGLFQIPERYYLLVVLSLGALFFIPFLGHLNLFDWDEINFAESSREMMVTGDYFRVQINFQPFWEKPPLFMWLQVAAMNLFGQNEFAARLPNAIFGLLTLGSIFSIGKKLQSPRFGLTWALVYLMSFLPHIYFKSGIIDPVFNYFIFLSIYFLIRSICDSSNCFAMLTGLFAGLAFLTKGPVAFILIGLTYLIYQVWGKFSRPGKAGHIALAVLATILVSSVWLIPEVYKNGWKTIGDFLDYQVRLFSTPDAGHKQPFFYHLLVVFIGCFPMSIFSRPLFKPKQYPATQDFTRWMVILFWVVMILFSIVSTKIVHYSSMCWLPLSFCAAIMIRELMKSEKAMGKALRKCFLYGGLLFSLILTLVPLVGLFKKQLIPYIKDPFAVANLGIPVDWHGGLVLIGLAFALCVVMSYRMLGRRELMRFLSLQSLATGITLFTYLLWVVPRIEQHSQRTAIDFYKSIADEDAYVSTIGFKSYAHYYYGRIKNTGNPFRNDQEWLLRGPIDKPVYFVTKSTMNQLDDPQLQGIQLLKNQGGFKFYIRTP